MTSDQIAAELATLPLIVRGSRDKVFRAIRGLQEAAAQAGAQKAFSLNLNDAGQNFAGVATIRAAIADLLDAGWQCGKGCDLHHPWCFPTEMFSGDREPTDGEIELRGKFVDAVIARIAELQNPPHSGVKLENLCDMHKRRVLPAPTNTVCGMCERRVGR